MLVLLAVPVILFVSLCHHVLQRHAPSNRLLRRARVSDPTWRLAIAHALLALGCVFALHLVALAMASGATEALYLLVMLLAWDCIKFAASAVLTFLCMSARLYGRFASAFHVQKMSRREGSFGAATTGSSG